MDRCTSLLVTTTVLAVCIGYSLADSPLSTHILDTTVGKPAPNVTIRAYKANGDKWDLYGACSTNDDGRCNDLMTQEDFTRSTYKLFFDTGCYFARTNTETFFPYIEIVFQVADPKQHYHVPLLLNPFSYSTYRGS